MAVFILNVLAFILVGLQLCRSSAQLRGAERREYTAVAGAVCAAVIVARLVWVMGTNLVRGRSWASQGHRGAPGRGLVRMRGTVTLAAALALPADFPYRDLILFSAFSWCWAPWSSRG